MARYLTYSPGRRRPWTEHASFPAKAIQLWREGGSYRQSKSVFQVYELTDDGTGITFIPPEDWDIE